MLLIEGCIVWPDILTARPDESVGPHCTLFKSINASKMKMFAYYRIRGTKRRFPPKYIENIFQAIQGPFRYLEMHPSGAIKFVSFRSS